MCIRDRRLSARPSPLPIPEKHWPRRVRARRSPRSEENCKAPQRHGPAMAAQRELQDNIPEDHHLAGWVNARAEVDGASRPARVSGCSGSCHWCSTKNMSPPARCAGFVLAGWPPPWLEAAGAHTRRGRAGAREGTAGAPIHRASRGPPGRRGPTQLPRPGEKLAERKKIF